MFWKKREPIPFDKTNFTGLVSGVVAVLGYSSGLTREQTENVWERIARKPWPNR